MVEQVSWTGERHATAQFKLVEILKRVWNVSRVAVDSTGAGEPVACYLREVMGNRVIPFVFSAPSKSELGFEFLAIVNSGRLTLYRPDGSPEYASTMRELEMARAVYRPNRTLNFFLDPADGHDDFLMSLALCCRAVRDHLPRQAHGYQRAAV